MEKYGKKDANGAISNFAYDIGGVGFNVALNVGSAALDYVTLGFASYATTALYVANNLDDMLTQASEKQLLNDESINYLKNLGVAGVHATTQQILENYTGFIVDNTLGKTKVGKFLNGTLKGTKGRIIKSGMGEGLEEILQNPLEYYFMREYGVEEEKEVSDIITDTLYSGLLGFIGGAAPQGGKELKFNMNNKQDFLNVQERLVKAGINQDKAIELTKEIYNEAIESGTTFLMEYNKLINNDTQQAKYTSIDANVKSVLEDIRDNGRLLTNTINDFTDNLKNDLIATNKYTEDEIENITTSIRQQITAIAKNYGLKGKELQSLFDKYKVAVMDGTINNDNVETAAQNKYEQMTKTDKDFTTFFNDSKNAINDKQFINIKSNDNVVFSITDGRLKHIQNRHPDITAEDINKVLINFNKDAIKDYVKTKKRQYGNGFLFKLNIEGEFYGVALEQSNNNYITTLFKDSEGAIDTWINNEKNKAELSSNNGDLSPLDDIITQLKNNVKTFKQDGDCLLIYHLQLINIYFLYILSLYNFYYLLL